MRRQFGWRSRHKANKRRKERIKKLKEFDENEEEGDISSSTSRADAHHMDLSFSRNQSSLKDRQTNDKQKPSAPNPSLTITF